MLLLRISMFIKIPWIGYSDFLKVNNIQSAIPLFIFRQLPKNSTLVLKIIFSFNIFSSINMTLENIKHSDNGRFI